MAASPPPYTPPPTNDPRQQKAYWRAQKAALRTQRDYWRAQRRDQRYYWRSMHRPSIAGPIVLLAIGIVALLITAGKLSGPAFWDWFVRWWPMLLIGLGLISLLEWSLDRDQPYRRTRGTFGIILLISLFVGIAYSRTYSRDHWNRWSNEIGAGDAGDWFPMGEEHEHDADSSVTVPANASVAVQNPRGDVTITGSTDNQLHVHAHQIVNTNSDSDAAGIFPALEPKVTVNGSSVLVKVESRNNARVLLTIELPEGGSTDVTAGRGDVSVEGLKGSSNITAGHGDVKLTSIGGSVHVHMSRGDFSAHEIAGTVSIDGHFGDVTVSEVTGNLSMEGDFFGDTHLEQIGSNTHFHSSRTDLDVGRLAGELTMDSDDLHVAQAVGPLRIVTRSKNIDCSQVSGDVHIENENGEVTVDAVAPLGNIQITNASNPVTLTLPPNANFSINATTNGGDLDTDFTLNVSGSDEHRNANGTVGKGGPKIDLNVRHGDISIKKGDANMPPMPPMPAMPVMPVTPKMPTPPSGPVKHLHAPSDEKPEPNVL
jgi:DUF4097 and DUF4098 domain-containing protein YvlB